MSTYAGDTSDINRSELPAARYPAYRLTMTICAAGAFAMSVSTIWAIFCLDNSSVAGSVAGSVVGLAWELWPYGLTLLIATGLSRRPLASWMFLVVAPLICIGATLLMIAWIGQIKSMRTTGARDCVTGGMLIPLALPILHAFTAITCGMTTFFIDAIYRWVRSGCRMNALVAKPDRGTTLTYAPLGLCPMVLGGAILLWGYASSSMVRPPHVGAVYWHRVLANMYPTMMLPLALINAGLATIIGCVAYAASGRSTPARIGLCSWLVLTVVEAVGLGLLARS